VDFSEGDTVGVAMQRAGVTTFGRSFKYHRRRGLLCLTGDCPNCLVTIDGTPLERACVIPAQAGLDVRRETGFPSVERDVLAVTDRLHWLLPVGFYYKTMLRPRWAWPRIEPVVRRISGRGTPSPDADVRERRRRHRRVDVAVVGGGVAGLSAAIAAAETGESVYLGEAYAIGQLLPPGPERDRLSALADRAHALGCELRERATAVGIYEGPLVVVSTDEGIDLVRPRRIVIATGAVEELPVFRGNDLLGIWLARGAELLASRYGVSPGKRVVVSGEDKDRRAALLSERGADVRTVEATRVAHGRTRLVAITDGAGKRRECDALVLGGRLVARDNLARQEPAEVLLAGDALLPGCAFADAEDTGYAAGRGERRPAKRIPLGAAPIEGTVCLCEDVAADDLALAWFEGFRSTELLKRYTTATMGPCQGMFCHRHLRSFVAERVGSEEVAAAAATTARPPARPLSVEDAAAGVRPVIEARTRLHDQHAQLGAVMEPLGAWSRPKTYGDPLAEYWAVRRGVSVMDVGTLGKFLVFGPDAEQLLDRVFPCSVRDLAVGQVRYTVMLSEQGYVVDDGLVCRLDRSRFYVTSTSGGAQGAESVFRDWADMWGLHVYILDETASRGAINLCGPKARMLLERLTNQPVSAEALPYLYIREFDVAYVTCRAIRLGFVGELSFELHHASSESSVLWDALLTVGADLGILPHGTEALRTLRLEKGHLLIGQDTDLDASPDKLGMLGLVRLDKPDFVGREALRSILGRAPRRQLCAFEFEGDRAPAEGAPLVVDGAYAGHLTSSRFSPVLAKGVTLGWVENRDGGIPRLVHADGLDGVRVDRAFYDPEGARVRA
jgi:sarcosine oxidase subunit alpha